MAPFFKSIIRSESGSGKENDKIVNTAEKKLAKLETAEEGRKATVQDFDQWINDPNVLNQLQNGVNRWIREIQKMWLVCSAGDCSGPYKEAVAELMRDIFNCKVDNH
ncbi:cytoplasmic dynein 1 heavy chain 1-like isoform X2 [Paramacrobiotus metropolitanus]|uniref:cytoplasmic dynein 1 heavy chain 1-like isoform X2 n=1 Tax=Paramacrobiotus metropolitanus TaxID=2943436 RepID=UPI0024456C82|nr:cytoplasmic dynein 1 heavy chain 1-like isoform X2 [Paramacrobiotus metropolitanus]